MLIQLRLRNFRGFRDHVVQFNAFSIVTGRNNAGKSTLFEAVRLVAEVMRRLPNGPYIKAREWTGASGIGISLTLEQVGLRSATLFHRYHQPPATLHATFSDGTSVEVFLGADGEIYAEAASANGLNIASRQAARKAALPIIAVLPQIGPLEKRERTLRGGYVQSCLDSHLASRHFRNQIRYCYSAFEVFCELFHQTWHRVRVSSFDNPNADHEDELSLLLSEDGFVAEAADFGHGMQMWLQIVWFLARTNPDGIVVLDEPDVYIHPEQQARMIQLLRRRFRQCLISTHAPAIIEQCSPSEILRVHRVLAESMPGVELELHEQQVNETLMKEQESALQKQTHGTSLPTEIVDPAVDGSRFHMRVVVYDEAEFLARDLNGKIILEVSANQCEIGRTVEKDCFVEEFIVETTAPDDTELFIDGHHIGIEGQRDGRFTMMKIALADYRE